MPRFVLSKAAIRDFGDIATFVTERSGSVRLGRDFIKALRNRCVDLAQLPGTMGIPRPEFGTEVRAAFHGNYVIFFRYEPGALRVIRVIEGHRNMAQHVSNGDT